MTAFLHTRLDNGLTLIGEGNGDALSLAMGFFARTGSRDESAETHGVSHFLEHMVFKGTERRTCFDVNREFDEIGAHNNAFTSEENTVYYAAVLPEYQSRALDLLADLMRPSLRQTDFDAEKSIILEEIAMYHDRPHYCAYDAALLLHFGGHPLGRTVLGTNASVSALSRDRMLAYFGERYSPGNMVLACSGRFDWEGLVGEASRLCGHWEPCAVDRELLPATPTGRCQTICRADVAREHLVMLSGAPAAASPDRFAAGLLACVVGDVLGSRFYWELVDPGHADVADMGHDEFDGAGAMMTYVRCDPGRSDEVVSRVRDSLARVMQAGVRQEELDGAKNKVCSRLVLGEETPMGRLVPLGYDWQYRREYRCTEDDLRDVRAVTTDDIRRVLEQHPLDQLTMVALGPVESVAGW